MQNENYVPSKWRPLIVEAGIIEAEDAVRDL